MHLQSIKSAAELGGSLEVEAAGERLCDRASHAQRRAQPRQQAPRAAAAAVGVGRGHQLVAAVAALCQGRRPAGELIGARLFGSSWSLLSLSVLCGVVRVVVVEWCLCCVVVVREWRQEEQQKEQKKGANRPAE